MSVKNGSADESSEVSDSEIDSYEARLYTKLKAGKYEVKNSDGCYRCPFCSGEGTYELLYEEILQHALGISSSNSEEKIRAKHRAYTKYLTMDVDGESGDSPQPMVTKQEPSPRSKKGDQFVWPWMGVLVNLPTEWKDGRHVGKSGTVFKEQLHEFHPLKVHPLWNFRGHTGSAIVDFSRDWSGFKDAMAFEKHFEMEHCSRTDWLGQNSHKPVMYGWVARTEDYHSGGPIGEHLRRNGDLKTVADVTKEENQKNEKLVADLSNCIEVKKQHLKELEIKCHQSATSLDKMTEDRDRLICSYNSGEILDVMGVSTNHHFRSYVIEEGSVGPPLLSDPSSPVRRDPDDLSHPDPDTEIKRMRCLAHDHSRRIFEENEKLRSELDCKKKELDSQIEQLNMLVGQSEMEKKRLEEVKKKNAEKSGCLLLATLEQKRADDNYMKLVEEQKREQEALLQKILQLEKKLNAKQKLELEIEQLKGKVEVMKHIKGMDDMGVKKMSEELQDKIDDLEDMERTTQALIVRERKSNDEIQEAHNELIVGLKEVQEGQRKIGVRRIGELDVKIFQKVCRKIFGKEEGDIKATEVCKFWRHELTKPDWHPFKVVAKDGKPEELEDIIDETDEKLVRIKTELGDEVYEAMTRALLETKEYSSSGSNPVYELWNFKEERQAPMKEVLQYVITEWKARKSGR